MDTSHTPGPWTAIDKDVYHCDTKCLNKVASAATGEDARLIASAPELLEALIDLLDRNPQINHGVLFARAAIAKAQ